MGILNLFLSIPDHAFVIEAGIALRWVTFEALLKALEVPRDNTQL